MLDQRKTFKLVENGVLLCFKENKIKLKFYLVKIKQFVNLGEYESLCENNYFGVQQDLVLGPWLLYLN